MKPYDLFVRFLITKGVIEPKEINDKLTREFGLPSIDDVEFKNAFALVHDKTPPFISKRIVDKQYNHPEFYKWMGILEVRELWDYEKEFFKEHARYVKLVYAVHDDPKMRVTLNALLMKGSVEKDICQDINSKFSAMMKPEVVNTYRKFFWNANKMSRSAWRAYLRHTEEFETSVYFVALTENMEVLRTHLELPSKAAISENLQYLFTQSFLRARQLLRLNSPETNAEARRWIKLTADMADKYAKHRVGDAEDFSKSLQMEFEYVSNEFPTPDDMLLKEVAGKKPDGTNREEVDE